MARGNFDACLAETLGFEGGYVDHPRDPGGATNMGITHRTLAAYRGVKRVTKKAVRALTRFEAGEIYHKRYWNPSLGDQLSVGVDLVTFDAAVNSGPRRSARWLQMALGVPADGGIGPATLGADDVKSPVATVKTAIAMRRRFLRGLKTWPTFGKGWTRRVNSVEARALALARVNPAGDKAAGGIGVGSGVGAGQALNDPQSIEQVTGVASPEWLIWVLVAIVVAALGYFAWTRRSRLARLTSWITEMVDDATEALRSPMPFLAAFRRIRKDIAAQAGATIDDIKEALT
ncbi:MAG: glycoside hydrolase family 108 protein [Alphaproteobacteria bacterium]